MKTILTIRLLNIFSGQPLYSQAIKLLDKQKSFR